MLSFGQRLKLLRSEANISQSDLADALEVSAQSVSKWECDAYCPDLSLLLPLSAVLGVTTDCLLGAGTNEKEDLEKLNEELKETEQHSYFDYESNLKRFEAARAFLKKYPLNYKVKLDCISYLGTLLYHSGWPNSYTIPENEFERLYDEGIKMILSLVDHDKDPSRLIHVRKHWIMFLTMKKKWDEAEAVAMEFPDISGMRKGMLAEIAWQKKDSVRALELWKEISSESANEYSTIMYMVGTSASAFGNERKQEAIEAWRDMKRVSKAFVDVFSKYSPEDHFNKVKSLLQAECKISNESLYINDIETALSSLEEATEIAVTAYEKIKSFGAGEELLDSVRKEFRSIPARCYNAVIADDDNILTREERFKACKKRFDELE